jgi:hypothetical protein
VAGALGTSRSAPAAAAAATRRFTGQVRLLDERIGIVRGRHGDERNGQVNLELLVPRLIAAGVACPVVMHDREDDPTPARCRALKRRRMLVRFPNLRR